MPHDLTGITELDPLEKLRAAACGDIDAQRKLACNAIWQVCRSQHDGYDVPLLLVLEGIMWARLAAAHGDQEDTIRLGNMLSDATRHLPEIEPELSGEAIARLQHYAEGGDEDAAEALNRFAAVASPQAMLVAKAYAERLAIHMPHNTPEDN